MLSGGHAGFASTTGIAWTGLTAKFEWLETVVGVVNSFFGQTYQSYGAHPVGKAPRIYPHSDRRNA